MSLINGTVGWADKTPVTMQHRDWETVMPGTACAEQRFITSLTESQWHKKWGPDSWFSLFSSYN